MKRSILVVTNLYPSSKEPVKGLYIKQLVDYLGSDYEVRVIAPVPWLPAWATRWRPASAVPAEESVDGVRVYHPRYVVIPKILRFTHGFTFAASVRKAMAALRNEFPFELISVHWMFPDVFGTVLAARSQRVPIVAHALGCDINDYLRYPLRRSMIRWALERVSGVVTKSGEIADKVRSLGIGDDKVVTIHNGVSRELFHVRDKGGQRKALGLPLDREIVLFVGNFSVEKGITFMLEAVAEVRKSRPNLLLCLIGNGPLRDSVEAGLDDLNLAGCARLLGNVPHGQVPFYLNAADVLCLPSLREGCPNVVLESLASGTPVVASAVGAIPEMMARTRIGFMTEPGDVPELAAALGRALDVADDADRSFDWFSWEDNARAVSAEFARHMAAPGRDGLVPDQTAA